MDRGAREPWERPKLVVLTRGEREEHVLIVCKADTVQGGPTSAWDGGCERLPGMCVLCDSLALS